MPADRFTIVPNDYLRDNRLSWEARGLLAWLMSHAASFKVTEEGMIGDGNMGRDGIRRMVRELETHGYLRRDKTFTPGVGTTVDYVLTDPYDGKTVVSDDGEPVVRADQAQQDLFAGQPYDGEAVAPSYKKENQEKTKTPSVSMRAERATRLSEDFEPDEKMREWYAAEKLSNSIDGRIEHQKFMNYWLAKPGKDGRKTDWRRTWMNWMLGAAERANRYGIRRSPGTDLAPVSGAPYRPSTTDQRVGQAWDLAAKYEQMGM